MSFVILFIYHWVIFCNISPFQLSVLSVFTFVLRYFLIYICIPFPRFFDVVGPVSSVLTSRRLHAKCGRNLDSCGVWKSHSAPTYGSPLQLLPVHFQSELHVLSFLAVYVFYFYYYFYCAHFALSVRFRSDRPSSMLVLTPPSLSHR